MSFARVLLFLLLVSYLPFVDPRWIFQDHGFARLIFCNYDILLSRVGGRWFREITEDISEHVLIQVNLF